ncbi:CDGSH iron-sulfur domain-containing protein [Paraburkholderia hospita]|jgi:3-phenylpropionate/trans-cinnamate dioxygenase ferredoxin subunit|uniref:Iron-binding protein n=1 Tax=Paraburkholderia hospita TaxID=169430 RepID=A0AAN1JBB8_9BURK|nr:CDGSH iron-sulfur domain-containing protein [Paraburkholderia hospita]AUT70711.1 iron-binding protein [Paraburkholderia hospita]EIM97364.1 zinc finger CDGSH-type domain containing protein [Paraburkholderia hospita]OUL69489.1 iron-binding protein [Paraburkholderia hospita]OUL90950.1 iron-binding protein [Paraburkholderia hospita]SEI28429.1 3-phenylpropionate/trans-cinnamate dioxygenase ferredoxin subunit [Paraburkholderia hospita]
MSTAIITTQNDGPYHITGDFQITTQSGQPIAAGKNEVWLCRCGQSSHKPLCDGSHKKVRFSSNLDEESQKGQKP